MIDKAIPEIIITEAKDLNPPLGGDLDGFLDGIMKSARQNFEDDHEITPVFLALKGVQINYGPVGDINDDTKDALFAWMQEQVPLNDCCIFVNEVWMAKAMKSEFKDGIGCLILPRDRIDRRECVMLSIFTPTRKLQMIAEITRKPDALGPWNKLGDTADTSQDAMKPCGRMIGVPIPGEMENS